MNQDNRAFKGVWISREIWLKEGLNAVQKMLLAEIDSLDNEFGCTAENAYFAKFLGVSIATVSRAIQELSKQELIGVTYAADNSRTIRSKLYHIYSSYQNDKRSNQNDKRSNQNDKRSNQNDMTRNNTFTNTFNNKFNNSSSEKISENETEEEEEIFYKNSTNSKTEILQEEEKEKEDFKAGAAAAVTTDDCFALISTWIKQNTPQYELMKQTLGIKTREEAIANIKAQIDFWFYSQNFGNRLRKDPGNFFAAYFVSGVKGRPKSVRVAEVEKNRTRQQVEKTVCERYPLYLSGFSGSNWENLCKPLTETQFLSRLEAIVGKIKKREMMI